MCMGGFIQLRGRPAIAILMRDTMLRISLVECLSNVIVGPPFLLDRVRRQHLSFSPSYCSTKLGTGASSIGSLSPNGLHHPCPPPKAYSRCHILRLQYQVTIMANKFI